MPLPGGMDGTFLFGFSATMASVVMSRSVRVVHRGQIALTEFSFIHGELRPH